MRTHSGEEAVLGEDVALVLDWSSSAVLCFENLASSPWAVAWGVEAGTYHLA
jgi:hypothetical protein